MKRFDIDDALMLSIYGGIAFTIVLTMLLAAHNVGRMIGWWS